MTAVQSNMANRVRMIGIKASCVVTHTSEQLSTHSDRMAGLWMNRNAVCTSSTVAMPVAQTVQKTWVQRMPTSNWNWKGGVT